MKMPPKARVPAAQRQATYRLNHLEQELARGRTHAARRRAKSKSSPTLDAVAKIQANQYAAGYRATNRARLAQKEMLRHCQKTIDKIGYDAWLDTWQRRHPGQTPPCERGDTQSPPSMLPPNNDDEVHDVELEELVQSKRRKRAQRCNKLEELETAWQEVEWAQQLDELEAAGAGSESGV
ncbi:hypothetical protein FB45DRAFT_1039807 [Roridomyces roridus]|uniref:Uncharacterized protein n=1 Tax=Roridomyces roridus TaxID=1738132 RepID=A0AAD7B2Q5_9AGAR|nr:hypothetical protein FB45DRAFT_1039807 [Roridomyces roridus]